MKKMLKIIMVSGMAAFIIITMGFSFISCRASVSENGNAQTVLEKIIATKSVKVGIITTVPPHAYLDENNNPTGYDFKFASELGQSLAGEDGEVEYVDLVTENRVPAVQTGQVDLGVFVLGNFPARAKLILYSTFPYFTLGIGVFSYADVQIESAEDLAGLNVGVVKGTNGHEYIEAKGPEGININYFDDDVLQLNALLAGQLDAVTTSDALADEMMKKYPDKNLEWKYTCFLSPVYVVTQHGQYDLVNVIDSFIISNYYNGNLEMWWNEYMNIPFGPLPGVSIN